jgi:HEAT repeat protein
MRVQNPAARGPVAGDHTVPAPDSTARLHQADLPGRAATTLEMAWVLAMQQSQRAPVTRPTTTQARRQAAVAQVLSRSRFAPVEQDKSDAPMPLTHVLRAIESGSIDAEARAAALQRIPAGLLYQRMQDSATESLRVQLSLALAQSPDPAAPALVIRLAQEHPALARQAVAQAPSGAAAVLRLADLLSSPSVPQRESAAHLLSASNDPAVYSALHARLQHPSGRREALMALLMSDSEIARALIDLAETHPELRAAVISLRLQGTAPSPPSAQPQPIAL